MTVPAEKLPYLDSLRGVAILMVILVHTAQSVPALPASYLAVATYSQLGVQLFFLVSAFTLSLAGDRHGFEESQLKGFFIRRFFRIAPLYYLGIVWYFLFNTATSSLQADHFRLAKDYSLINMLANFLFVHGFYFPANNTIVPGGWSIGTEMAFYVCFPLLFLIFRKMNAQGIAKLLALFILIISSYYVLEGWLVPWADLAEVRKKFLYYNLLNQLPVFMLGILLYFLARQQVLAKIPTAINLAGLGLFGWITIQLWHAKWTATSPLMFIPFTAGLGFVCLHNLFASHPGINFLILRRIGQVSYSMYIWHFMCAWYGAQYLNQWLDGRIPPVGLLTLYYTLSSLLSFGLATMTERLIERPGIELGRRLS